MQDIFCKIQNDLKHMLKEKRYIHTMGVVESAISLCEIYDCDVQKAKISALLHDIAKNLSTEELLQKTKKFNIIFDHVEKENKQLQHAKVGMCMAKYIYDIQDIDILNAIRYHTTGRENMSKLEKIICLADYIEKNRDFEGVDEIRRLSKIDLNYALYSAFNTTIIHLSKNNQTIHIDTVNARNYLLKYCPQYIEI